MVKIKGYSKLISNYYSIKKYNDDLYKFTFHKYPIRNLEFEKINNVPMNRSRDVNDEKLDNHIARAKTKIFEYAACNEFDYFTTLTLNEKKYDRYNLGKFIKDLGQMIRNYRRDFKVDIQYLLIPELHLDGAWHMHGLFKGIPIEHLKLFTLEDKLPYRLRELIMEGRKIYNWEKYAEKFGWCTLEQVINQEAVSKYITKYIRKSLNTDLKREKEKKLYYISRGLKSAVKVKEGTINGQLTVPYEYENDYVKTKMLNGLEYLRLQNQL
mgnify:CR=1 FL=1